MDELSHARLATGEMPLAIYLKGAFDLREGESAQLYAIMMLSRYRRWEIALKKALAAYVEKWPEHRDMEERAENVPILVAAELIAHMRERTMCEKSERRMEDEIFHENVANELSQFRDALRDLFDIREGESALAFAMALLRRYRRWEIKLRQALRDRACKFPNVEGLDDANRTFGKGTTEEEEDAPIRVAALIIGRSGQ
jgi:hypothetical protein